VTRRNPRSWPLLRWLGSVWRHQVSRDGRRRVGHLAARSRRKSRHRHQGVEGLRRRSCGHPAMFAGLSSTSGCRSRDGPVTSDRAEDPPPRSHPQRGKRQSALQTPCGCATDEVKRSSGSSGSDRDDVLSSRTWHWQSLEQRRSSASSPAPAEGRSGRFNRTTSIGGTSEIRGTR